MLSHSGEWHSAFCTTFKHFSCYLYPDRELSEHCKWLKMILTVAAELAGVQRRALARAVPKGGSTVLELTHLVACWYQVSITPTNHISNEISHCNSCAFLLRGRCAHQISSISPISPHRWALHNHLHCSEAGKHTLHCWRSRRSCSEQLNWAFRISYRTRTIIETLSLISWHHLLPWSTRGNDNAIVLTQLSREVWKQQLIVQTSTQEQTTEVVNPAQCLDSMLKSRTDKFLREYEWAKMRRCKQNA